ncbi:myb domain-containing protein [Reticulomyxa filosa]|uniref:Myb domain-containing protein n=1 Tax=Reticulomyxa filosa TaxID=46433 RepID=X6NP71_RETFI|nr:myb domain-containing protein [Reticulomyxa filosa]|eukprot:ETO27479.1 myb domain-containing protein [Reticulomyxa filosa]
MEKPYNAYMLVYRQKLVENKELEKKLESDNGKQLRIAEPVERNIWQDHLEFFTDRNVFDFDYLTFLWNIVETVLVRCGDSERKKKYSSSEFALVPTLREINETRPSEDDVLRTIQITTSFVFEVLVRSKDNASYPQWMQELYQLYVMSQPGRRWLLHKVCTQPQWFANIVFRCTHEAVRLAFVDLLLGVLMMQRSHEKHNYMKFVEALNRNDTAESADEWPNLNQSSSAEILNADHFCCARFITKMVRYLALTTEYHREYHNFFVLLHGIATLGWEERRLMIRIGTIRAIIAFYQNDWFHMHFNRGILQQTKENSNDNNANSNNANGSNNNNSNSNNGNSDNKGKKQFKRILPPRVNELIKLLSVLIRSCSTATFIAPTDLNRIQAMERSKRVEVAKPSAVVTQPVETQPSPQQSTQDIKTHQDLQSQVSVTTQVQSETSPQVEVNAQSTQAITATTATTTTNADTRPAQPSDNTASSASQSEMKTKEENKTSEAEKTAEAKGKKKTSKMTEIDFSKIDVKACTQRPPNCMDKERDPILLDEQDRWAIWCGFDPNLPFDSHNSWKLSSAIDPLPSLEEYQRYQEDQKHLQQYQKDHKNEPLPPDLQKISQQKAPTHFPRKLTKVSLFIRLTSDRSGDYGDCPHEATVRDILLYWCFNNKPFTDHVLSWCLGNLREEFNNHRNDFLPWLLLMEKILQQRDMYFEKNCRFWISRLSQLLNNCAETNASGTDLLMYQLMSWFQRLTVRVPEIAEIITQNVELYSIIDRLLFFLSFFFLYLFLNQTTMFSCCLLF